MKLPKPELPLRTTLLYLLFGGLWILLSDQLLSLFVFHNAQQATFQIIKGWFFILVSSTLLYIFLLGEDVKRKLADEAVRTSEQRYRLIAQNAEDMIWTMDLDFRLTYVSPGVERALGYSAEEILSTPSEQFLTPESYAVGLNVFREEVEKAQSQPDPNYARILELEYRRRNRTTFWVEMKFSLFRDSNGRPTGVLGVGRDITERKRAEQETAWLASFPKQNPNPIVEIDSTGAVFYMNPEAQCRFPDLPTQGFKHPWLAGLENVVARFQQGEIGEMHREIQIGEAWYSQSPYYVADVARLRVYGTDISERKQAELELQRTSHWLLASQRISATGGWAINLKTGKVWASPEARRIYGIDDRELTLAMIQAFPLPQYRQALTSALQELIDQGLPYDVEFQIARGTNSEIIDLHSLAEYDAAEHVVLGVVRDVTDQKRAEQALRASEERFRLLFENNHTVMLLIEPVSGIIRNANRAAAEYYGYSLAELRVMNINDINQLTPEEVQAERMRAVKEERNFFNFQHRLSNGEIRSVEVHSTPIEVDGNTFLFSIVVDNTERKQAEDEIQRQLKRLNALHMIDIAISSSFDLNIILDVVLQQVLPLLAVDATSVILSNSQLQTMEYAASRGFRSNSIHYTKLRPGEGYASQAVLKRKTIHISGLMERGGKLAKTPQLAQEEFVDYYGTPLIVKGEVKGVLEVYHRSYLRVDAQWLEFLETLAGQAAIAIDNAQLFEKLQRSNFNLERRVAERTAELNHTNAELERANRIKDEFLANMSHELRTPLTSILGLSESLLEQRRGPLNDHQQRSVEIIESSGQHLLDLINDILDLSKIEAGKFDYYPEPISVDEICRSSLSFVKSLAAKKSITVTCIQDIPISKIYADPRRLKQILVNLLTNAVKFTLNNGEVILQVKADPEQDSIKFSVIDNGIGIAPENFQRLFQPFVQVDSGLNRQQEGTGLGLALVQKLTDLHGGSVQVESEVGKGSCFTISLPYLQEELAKLENRESDSAPLTNAQADAAELPEEASVHLGVILLADDNMPSILTIGEYMESYGYEVVAAHDGLEVIQKAEVFQPDIILMDIQMPSMNGWEAIAHLRGNPQFKTTPIIALTALAMPGDRERSLLAGANEYMSKPVSLKVLAKTIERMLKFGKDLSQS